MRIRSNEDVPGLGIALLPSLEDVAVRAGVTIDAIAGGVVYSPPGFVIPVLVTGINRATRLNHMFS